MNERYLFRGKTGIGEQWIVGDLMQWDDGTRQISVNDDDGAKSKYTVIPETVGQCTGLKDKNGKLIFEGDIVVSTSDRRHSDRPRLITIDFERGCHYCAAKRKSVVIGNIHDNPELLRYRND